MLHVTDQRVLPIANIQGTVRPKLQVDRTEVPILRPQDEFHFLRPKARAVPLHDMLVDALFPNAIVEQEVALQFRWEMAARNEFATGGRSKSLFDELIQFGMFAVVSDVSREGGAKVIRATRRIGHEILPPSIKDVSPRIGKVIGDKDVQLFAQRFVSKDARVLHPYRPVWRLDLTVVEGALLKIKSTTGAPSERADRMVCVR